MSFTLPPPSRSSEPLYRQVEGYLRAQIASGTLRSGDMLPSVKELCDQFGGINHLTVRQAIKNLAEENLVRSVQGRGSFVTEQKARDRRVAIVLPHLEDTLFIRIAKGAQEVLETEGVHTIILDSRGGEGIEAGHIANLKNLPLDGALIFPIAHSNIAEQIFKLKLDEFCFVLVDRYFEDIAAPCVVVDNYQGGYQSAQYLAKQGRERVGWIGELRSTPARLRLEGFRAALNDSGIVCPASLIQKLEFSPNAPMSYHLAVREGVRGAVDALLQQTPRLDGLVCCDDLSALSALERLQELKIRVPEQIALIGFDDVPEAALSHPALTTVRQPMLQVGREAAQMLLERMDDNKNPIEKMLLPVELILRETA
ncbi:MAG: GntR family transcriptional regulator [Armatimonadetes bacterium]|nr:GntR family transcriptional regulator [Armatimonadota bacterium]